MRFRPLLFLASRYLLTRRKHRGAGSPLLSFLGLATGVLALNAVLSVMNGFQLTYIDSLVEVSSSHLRWTPLLAAEPAVEKALAQTPGVASVLPQTESQALLGADGGRQRGVIVRGLLPDALEQDTGLAANLRFQLGGMPGPGEVALGTQLARSLGVGPGSEVTLTALSGPAFSLLEPNAEVFSVAGLFTTGYYEIDASWVVTRLVPPPPGVPFPDGFWSVKLSHPEDADWMAGRLAKVSGRPASEFQSWKDFNQGFYAALRTEKTSMMVLVGLIFLVVGVNIYFSQRRAVLEHREDLALLQAAGTPAGQLRWIFVFEGLLVGLLAAVLGTVGGWGTSEVLGSLGLFSSDAFYIPMLPARMLPGEVTGIALASVLSATLAAWLASGHALKMPCGEVLKNT